MKLRVQSLILWTNFLKLLVAEDIGYVYQNVPLRDHCTWGIGEPADLLMEPRCIEHIKKALRFAINADISVVVIGNGTNLLFDDAGVRSIVMKIGQSLSKFSIEGTVYR